MSKIRFSREFPQSKNEFIADFLFSIKKRGKALKNQTSFMSYDRVFVEEDGTRLETIEFKLSPGHSSSASCYLVIHMWEDRWIQLSFSEWKDNTWDWSWNIEGSILPVYTGKTIVEVVELTLSLSFQMSASNIYKFDQLWKPLLVINPEME